MVEDREEGWQVEQEPQQVASNEWGTLTYYPEWKTLELKWTEKTRSMGADGFKQTLQLLADEGWVRPPGGKSGKKGGRPKLDWTINPAVALINRESVGEA